MRVLILMLLVSCWSGIVAQSSLAGRRVCIDPGHGGTATTDSYRVGQAGEREEWINLRVALLLKDKLEKLGAEVLMTRGEDVFVPLGDRAEMAKAFDAELFVSIHHNATADTSVNHPIIYFHGNSSENIASCEFAKLLVSEFLSKMYAHEHTPYTIASDFVIFPSNGAAVLRNTYGIPGVIGEASFFTNKTEEARLKDLSHNEAEAEAYLAAITRFFEGSSEIMPVGTRVQDVTRIAANQEAARMDEEAVHWNAMVDEALSALTRGHADLDRSKSLLLSVLGYFPDNARVREIYEGLAYIYGKQGDKHHRSKMLQRLKEYFVFIE